MVAAGAGVIAGHIMDSGYHYRIVERPGPGWVVQLWVGYRWSDISGVLPSKSQALRAIWALGGIVFEGRNQLKNEKDI